MLIRNGRIKGKLDYFLQIFFGNFNDDDLGDMMCFPSNDSRSLAQGDAAATFLVINAIF